MIHETAIVHPDATLGADVTIGPFTIIHPNVHIEDSVEIGSHCELGIESKLSDGSALHISEDSLIRSHSVFYESSSFGPGLVTGHRVTVRENTKAGAGLQLGSLCDIQGHCTFGEHVKLHSNVHICQKSKIGNCVWIFPYVVTTNDPHPPSNTLLTCTVEDYAVISTMSIILPGVTIGKGTLVGAHSNVGKDTEPDSLVIGSPAKSIGTTDRIKLRGDTGDSAYPWRRHFHRGYPESLVQEWIEEFKSESE